MKEVLEIVKKHWDIDALSADKLKGGMVNISWRITTPDASYVFVERREQQDIQTYIKLLECLDQQFYSRLAQPSLLPEKTLDNQRFVATEKGEYLLRPFVGDKKILAGNHFYELGKQIRILQECEPPVAMENWERRMFGEEDYSNLLGSLKREPGNKYFKELNTTIESCREEIDTVRNPVLTHGDLHGANIMLLYNHPFLIDWGCSRIDDSDYDPAIVLVQLARGYSYETATDFFKEFLRGYGKDWDTSITKKAQYINAYLSFRIYWRYNIFAPDNRWRNDYLLFWENQDFLRSQE